MTAFQAVDEGSIPSARTKKEQRFFDCGQSRSCFCKKQEEESKTLPDILRGTAEVKYRQGVLLL